MPDLVLRDDDGNALEGQFHPDDPLSRVNWNALLPKAPWYARFLPWRRRRNAVDRTVLEVTNPHGDNTELYMRMYQGGQAPQWAQHWQTAAAAIEPHPGVDITDAYSAASIELPRYAEFERELRDRYVDP